MISRLALPIAGAASILFLTACTSHGGVPSASPHPLASPSPVHLASVSSGSVPFVPPMESYGLIEPTSGLVETYPVPWLAWQQLSPTQLQFAFTGGGPLTVLGVETTVTETDQAVTVGISQGVRPEYAGKPIAGIGLQARIVVTLKRPLGSRAVVDPNNRYLSGN